MKSQLESCFRRAFLLELSTAELEKLEYQAILEWDSVGHMALVANIEDEFDIMFEMEDVIDLNSFSKALELVTRYKNQP